ncbi:hypothetical protein LXA43DRAFT_969840 [Ganoderma leucocontextum]|nr:hypothetical protein LXA43DRAFT_969840 [Ganoderma leucocontextum]
MCIARSNRVRMAPVFGHVNLMVDTLIANLELSDMQAIIRAHLCTTPQDATTSFMAAARTRLNRSMKGLKVPAPSALFSEAGDSSNAWKPTRELEEVLRTSRVSYGAGMGLAGLGLLTAVVAATARPGWKPDNETASLLADIDRDLCQAIVSSKQEMDAGRATREEAAGVQEALLHALNGCKHVLGEEYPFELGETEVEGWKTDRNLGC